jgi:hypothetical protein
MLATVTSPAGQGRPVFVYDTYDGVGKQRLVSIIDRDTVFQPAYALKRSWAASTQAQKSAVSPLIISVKTPPSSSTSAV